ncbi:MAG: Long chain fatty acid transport protein [uncultured bacterium]|nr:MAG: Long chain fatty acid transport protein [uncultured bacterium]
MLFVTTKAWRSTEAVITAPTRNRMGLERAHVGSNPTFSGYLLTIISALFFSSSIFASGFQLWEESASSLGDYHAGGAASAKDASSIFYNPAGATHIKHQEISAGVVYIPLDVTYHGTITLNGVPAQNSPTPPAGISGSTENYVPNFHYVLPINHRLAVAFEETTPFGLSTSYPSDGTGIGMLATVTKLKTINLNPSIAYAINDKISVGAGFDAMHGEAIYDDAIQSLGPITNSLTGWGYGYNAGVLMQLNSATRMGLSYRSAVTIVATGPSETSGVSSTVSAAFPLPATTMLSIYHDMSHRWAIMASAFYTQWSCFHELVIKNISQGAGFSPGTVALFENYRDTWNFSLGSRYRINHFWSIEAGAGHDETPTRLPYRDIRLPDNDRYAASLGVNYYPKSNLKFSAGWTHFFVDRTTINNSGSNDTSKTTTLLPPAVGIGYVDSQVNVFGLQLSWDF